MSDEDEDDLFGDSEKGEEEEEEGDLEDNARLVRNCCLAFLLASCRKTVPKQIFVLVLILVKAYVIMCSVSKSKNFIMFFGWS